METKVLLTNVNSVWGVIVNPQSSNTYRHAISFKDEQMKRDYVSQELFGGTDFTTLFAKQPEIDFTIITGSKAEFYIDTQQYPNETMLSLLNKDFCILKIGDKYYYYTLFGERQGATIKYTAELDIFFTYDIKEMFNDKESRISRAMTDRFYKDGNLIKPITENKTLQFNTPIYNEEDIKVTEDNLLVSSNRKTLSQKLEDISTFADTENLKEYIDYEVFSKYIDNLYFTYLASSLQDGKIPFVKETTGKIKQATSYFQSNNDEFNFGVGVDSNLSAEMNYGIIAAPLNDSLFSSPELNNLDPDKRKWRYDIKIKAQNSVFKKLTTKFLENTSIIKTSYSITPLIPLIGANIITTITVETFNNEPYVKVELVVEYSPNLTTDINTEDNSLNALIAINNIENKYMPMTIRDKDFTPIPKILENFTPNINEIVKNKHQYELKSYFAPYRKFNINSSTKNNTPVSPQMFSKNIFEFESKFRYLLENWGVITKIKNYKNFNIDKEFIEIENNEYIEDYNNYSLPTTIDAYEQFMIENQSQQNGQFLSKGLGLAAGVVGIGAAAFTGGASLGLLAAGAGLAAKSASDINQQLAQRRDISNTPDKQVNNGSTLTTDFNTKNFKTSIVEYKLPLNDDLLIKEHFYKYGYNYNSKLKNINEILDTRFWFDYIEIPESFENIKLQASAEIKQLINDTLASGLTIWHCRDLATFKGIKNYDYENVEMSLYSPVTKALNDYNKGIQ